MLRMFLPLWSRKMMWDNCSILPFSMRIINFSSTMYWKVLLFPLISTASSLVGQIHTWGIDPLANSLPQSGLGVTFHSPCKGRSHSRPSASTGTLMPSAHLSSPDVDTRPSRFPSHAGAYPLPMHTHVPVCLPLHEAYMQHRLLLLDHL